MLLREVERTQARHPTGAEAIPIKMPKRLLVVGTVLVEANKRVPLSPPRPKSNSSFIMRMHPTISEQGVRVFVKSIQAAMLLDGLALTIVPSL